MVVHDSTAEDGLAGRVRTVTAEAAGSSPVVPAIPFRHFQRIDKSAVGSDRLQAPLAGTFTVYHAYLSGIGRL